MLSDPRLWHGRLWLVPASHQAFLSVASGSNEAAALNRSCGKVAAEQFLAVPPMLWARDVATSALSLSCFHAGLAW